MLAATGVVRPPSAEIRSRRSSRFAVRCPTPDAIGGLQQLAAASTARTPRARHPAAMPETREEEAITAEEEGAAPRSAEGGGSLPQRLKAAFAWLTARVQRWTGLSHAAAVVLTAAAVAACLSGSSRHHLLSTLSGFVYPTYASFKALQTDRTDDDTHWLTYWVTFSTVHLAETVVPWLSLFPAYSVVKCVLVVWLQVCGTSFVFRRFIVPFLGKYQRRIDAGVAKLASRAQRAARQIEDVATENASAAAAARKGAHE